MLRNLLNALDDQLGISLLAPATKVAQTALSGGYIGGTLFQSPSAALLNPFTSALSSNFSLDFTQTQPGLVKVTVNKDLMSGGAAIYKAGDTGVMVRVGPVYGLLMNGVNQPSLTYDPANYAGKVNPFLSIGAFVQ